jgi:hypothetical protein
MIAKRHEIVLGIAVQISCLAVASLVFLTTLSEDASRTLSPIFSVVVICVALIWGAAVYVFPKRAWKTIVELAVVSVIWFLIFLTTIGVRDIVSYVSGEQAINSIKIAIALTTIPLFTAWALRKGINSKLFD